MALSHQSVKNHAPGHMTVIIQVSQAIQFCLGFLVWFGFFESKCGKAYVGLFENVFDFLLDAFSFVFNISKSLHLKANQLKTCHEC